MLDPKFIRENADKVRQNTLERGMDASFVDKWLEVDSTFKSKKGELESLNKRKNEIADLLKDSSKRTPELIEEGKQVKESISPLEEEIKSIESEWSDLIACIPNIHFDDVPEGKSDDENVEVRKWGEIPAFNFEPKDHVTLGNELGILDFDAGAKVSGSQFYFLKNDLVKLNYALIQFGLDFFEREGFTLVETPDLAKSKYYLGTGYAPRGDEAQIYEIDGEDLGLIATAEVTMAGLHSDQVLPRENFPLCYAALSHCFRKESGAYGKYSKGLYRVHQFTKLEMFVYCSPEQSKDMHTKLLDIEERIAQAIGIPYRVVEMCTGDLGAMVAKKYDLEAWMPGRNDYGEITSTSNCTDFQARNLNVKYKNDEGTNEYVHMLNGTAIVMSRFPIAILENFQQEDGSIKIPEALRPYMGGREFIGK